MGAEIPSAATTIRAVTTGGKIGFRGYLVAHLPPIDSLSQLHYSPSQFMPNCHRGSGLKLVEINVQISATDPGGVDFDDNLSGAGRWVVGGKRIVPSKIGKPALVMIPSGDRIVPPLSAAALADPKRGLKNATRLDLPLGHIGMVVSGRARELCWTPLIEWLKAP